MKPNNKRTSKNPEIWKYVELSLKYARNAGLAPLTFDQHKRQIVICQSLRFKLLFGLNYSILIGNQLYLFWLLLVIYHLHQQALLPASMLLFVIVSLLIQPITILLDGTDWLYQSEISYGMNALVQLIDSFDKKETSKENESTLSDDDNVDDHAPVQDDTEKPDPEKMIVNQLQSEVAILNKFQSWLHLLILKFLPIILISVSFMYFNEAFIIVQEVCRPLQCITGINLPTFVIHILVLFLLLMYVYLAFGVVVRLYALAVLTTTFGYYCSYIMDQLFKFFNPGPIDAAPILKINAIKTYRILSFASVILTNSFTYFSGICLISVLTICTFLLYFVAGNKNAPLGERAFGLNLLMFFGIFTTFVLHFSGSFHLNSKKLISTWTRNVHLMQGEEKKLKRGGLKDCQIQRRVLKTLRPFRFYAFGSIYFVDEKSALVFWSHVLDKTVLLLCLFPFK